MALSKIGILAVRGTRGLILKIAKNQGISKQAAYRWVEDNHENLTRATVLDMIISESGLTRDQILEQETTEEAQM